MSCDSACGRDILVTGGTGFLGSHLSLLLRQLGARVTSIGKDDLDLTQTSDVSLAFARYRPRVIFHLAGYNGGIGMNAAEPARIFHDNTVMGLNLLEAARRYNTIAMDKVEKVVCVVASCAYGDLDSCSEGRGHDLLEERTFLLGEPHESVACHGYAKRNLQLACSFYHKQYGLDAVCVCPTTLYGPGMSYDPKNSKLVGAMVKRFCDAADAGVEEVVCWGDGSPLRELMWVGDCAGLMVDAAGKYHDHDIPLNLGSGQELSVKDLAETVARLAGYKGVIRWDRTKPSGQRRKRLLCHTAGLLFPYYTPYPLELGLARCVEDYRQGRAA